MNRTAEQLMNLESLAFWLEQQPQYQKYSYWRIGNCLLALYYRDNGFPQARACIDVMLLYGDYSIWLEIPPEIHRVAYGNGFHLFRTFGGALKRARRALNTETQAHALQEAGAR